MASVRTRLLLIGLPLVAAAVTAALVLRFTGGSDGPGDPARFMTGLIQEIAANDYGGAWATLHPAHQRVATREAYVACEGQTPIPGKLSSVSVVDVSDKQVEVAGEAGTVEGKAVRLELSITGAGPDPIVVTHTSHAVAVAGHWTWILPPDRFAEYRAGRCPS